MTATTFQSTLSSAIQRIEAAHKDPNAFPKVSAMQMELLFELAGNRAGIATNDIQATKRLVPSCVQNVISGLAGLLAIHGAPVRIGRRREYSNATGRWAYHYFLFKVEK